MRESHERRSATGRTTGSHLAVDLETHHERPSAATGMLARDRLTGRLTESQKPLVMLAAPPGFGKTTLLHQWRDAEKRPFAWVSIDPGDDDPVHLWTRIVEALRAVDPSFDSAAQIALHAAQVDVLGAVVPLLAHDLRFVDGDVVLALDDYQNIHNEACHESLELFLNWLPESVTLVLSTRADPPVIPVGTMRARGELLELRAVDLCFTDEEEAAFLNETLGLGLADETLGMLHERTEGWPAGVYLASLSLRQAEDPAGFVAGFGGSNRHVVDYLTEVVLDSLDPRRRQFLLDTSILASVCGPLADALTGHEDSADLLEELERANLFIVALDDRREWYRYHQLFTDLLRAQLLHHDRKRLPTLHRRAFGWYREAGRIDEALRHAVAAGDVEAACDLVAERWAPRLDCGEARTTLRRLETLPAEAVVADARLSLARAWADGMTDQAEEGLPALRAAHGAGLAGSFPDGTSLEAGAAVVEACFPRRDAGAMLAAAVRARELEAGLSSLWRPLAPLALGWARYLAGEWEEAETSLRDAAMSAAESGQWLHVSIANALLACAAHAAGDDEHGEAWAHEALATLESHDLNDPLAAGLADLARGAALAHSDVAESEQALERALACLRTHGEPLLVAEALLTLAPVRRGRQGTQAGRRCIAEARELLDGCADAGMLDDRLEQVARSLTPAYRRTSGDTGLTERELEVLRYLAEGLPKRDIGATLFLSYNTIHSHTKSIYQKLRVSSREAAVAKARELGAL